MSATPEAARQLVLDLVRPQVEGRSCPRCGVLLGGCRLDLVGVEPDRVVVAASCCSCDANPAAAAARSRWRGGLDPLIR